MPDPFVWILVPVLGAVVGSFLNVAIHRWTHSESIVRPRSRCPACAAPIAWYDNIPVLGFLFLRGRCRSCGASISWQYPAVELATAALFAAIVADHGIGLEALRGIVLTCLLLGIAIADARHYLIPNEFSLGGLVVGLAFALAPGGIDIVPAVLGAAVGFSLLYVVGLLGSWVFRKPAMGPGDMKMMAMVGSFLGVRGVLLAIFLGALLGAAIFGPISWKTRKLVPFGVFLALGAAVAYAWGDAILGWYLRHLGETI